MPTIALLSAVPARQAAALGTRIRQPDGPTCSARQALGDIVRIPSHRECSDLIKTLEQTEMW
jgi:hypothetical protein